jgi:hypothetical protein
VPKSYVGELEQKLRTILPPYNIKPSRNDVDLLGTVEAQRRKVDALSKMAVDAIFPDKRLENGRSIHTEPSHVATLFANWLERIVSLSSLGSVDVDTVVGRLGNQEVADGNFEDLNEPLVKPLLPPESPLSSSLAGRQWHILWDENF